MGIMIPHTKGYVGMVFERAWFYRRNCQCLVTGLLFINVNRLL